MESNANPFNLDVDTLNLGEFGVIEDLTDLTFVEIIAGFATRAVSSPKFLLALTFVAGVRADPEFTLDDAANVLLVDLELFAEQDEE